MRGSPDNRDKAYEIARGRVFHADMPRRFGPILAAPGALRENPRGKSGYNLIGTRPGLRNGGQFGYRQYNSYYLYKLTSVCPFSINKVLLHPVCSFVLVSVWVVVCPSCGSLCLLHPGLLICFAFCCVGLLPIRSCSLLDDVWT
jgi:hypothetical protein